MNNQRDNKNLAYQYVGFGAQLLVGIGLAVYAGIWIDRWIKISIPLFVWLLPLVIIIALIVKAIKDTSSKKENE